MTPILWQRLIFALAIAAAAHVMLDVAGALRNGDIGADYVTIAGDPPRFRITNVTDPGSFDAPVHRGDTFAFPRSTVGERLHNATALAGDRVTLVTADGRRVIATQRWIAPNLEEVLYPAIPLAMIVIGGLLVLRRGDRIEVRTLASFLIFAGVMDTERAWPFVPDWVYLLNVYVGRCAIFLAFAQAVRLATLFPDPQAGGVRAFVRRINPFVTATLLAVTVFDVTAEFFFGHKLAIEDVAWRLALVYYSAAIAISFGIANLRATGADVSRVRWVSYSVAIGLLGFLMPVALIEIGFRPPWLAVFDIAVLAIPAGLSYAVLRHRVIDVGFVVTRALIFGIVSALLLAVFLIVEWLLTRVFLERNHVTSAAIEAFVALLLGVSLRTIHGRVEALADRLLFRARYRAEAALRSFSDDVLFITDVHSIYERTVQLVREHAEAAQAAIYVLDERRYTRVAGDAPLPPSIPENDDAFVRLRATRKTVDLHRLRSELNAELACPFVVRGHVAGALVCTGKRNGETYAPDEVDLLSGVARAVGVASDGLVSEGLGTEVQNVRAENAALSA